MNTVCFCLTFCLDNTKGKEKKVKSREKRNKIEKNVYILYSFIWFVLLRG